MNVSNIKIDGLTVKKFDALQSPAHYVKKEDGRYVAVKLGCCKCRYLSYHAEKIRLFFSRLGHFLTSGRWETDKTLLKHLHKRVTEINRNQIDISNDERQALQDIHRSLLARISGQVTNCTLDIIQTIASPNQSDVNNIDSEEEHSELEQELRVEVGNLEEDKKKIKKKEEKLEEIKLELEELTIPLTVDVIQEQESIQQITDELKNETNRIGSIIDKLKREKFELVTQNKRTLEEAKQKEETLNKQILKLQQEKSDIENKQDQTKYEVLDKQLDISFCNQQIDQLYKEKQALSLLCDTTIKVTKLREQKLLEQIEQLKKEQAELVNTLGNTVEVAKKKETELQDQINKLQQEKGELTKPNEKPIEEAKPKDPLLNEQIGKLEQSTFVEEVKKSSEEFVGEVNDFKQRFSEFISETRDGINSSRERGDGAEQKFQELSILYQQQKADLEMLKLQLIEREERIDELKNQIEEMEEPEILHVLPKRELSGPTREAKNSLDKKNFFFIDLLGAEEPSFANYLKFIAPIARDAENFITHGKDSSHPNFRKYVEEANNIFRAGLETAQNKIDSLHLQLCDELKNKNILVAKPRFSEDGTILICSAETLKAAFEIAKKDKDLQRLYKAAFDCNSNGPAINQKAEFNRLIQQLICGSKECEKRPLPKTPYCFGVEEIFNKTSPLMIDAKETSLDQSYLFTQAMTSNPDIKETHHKFTQIGEQYVKDACLRGGIEGTCVEINGKKLSFASDAVDEIQENYTKFLLGLSEEKFNTIVKEDSQSPLVKAALEAFTSGRYEQELEKEASALQEKLKNAASKDIDKFNKQLHQVEKKLKHLQKIKEDCKTSAFPESILQFILQEGLDYWSTSTESAGPKVHKRIVNTIKNSGFSDKGFIQKLAEKNKCSQEQVEPLIRYKILELICSLNQAVQATLVIHAKNESNLSFAGHPYNAVRKAPTTILLTGDRYDALSMQFDIGYKGENSDNYFMMSNFELSIDSSSQKSKATYRVFKDARFSYAVGPKEIDLIVKKMKPLNEYLDDLNTSIKNDVSNLATINTLSGGGVLSYEDEKFKIDHGFFGTGIVRPFVVPTDNVMDAVVDTFKKMRIKFEVLDKNLSAEKKNEMMKDIKQHLNTLEAIHIKLGKVVSTANSRVMSRYESIAEEFNEIKMIGFNWSSRDLIKEHIEKDDLKDFAQNADIDSIQESLKRSTTINKNINEDQATGYLTDAYAAYWKRFTESTDSKDFMWKTDKYDQMLGSMQAFIKDVLPKDHDFKEVFKKEGVGQSLSKLFEIMDEMKFDPNKRPDDHQTLDYQKRVRNLYQRFFIHLSVAAEAAVAYKDSDSDEKKCVEAILKLCEQLFNGINMKEASQHAVETFYPLVGLKDKGLCKSVREAYEAIKHADPYKKTPMHHGIWKSLIGHFNIGFNSWLAGNPVSQWFNTTFGNGTKISLLAFGSPTSETPTFAEVIAAFRAAMKQYALKGENHLYVSLQNFIPVKKQNGWKEKILGLFPNWIAGAAETILGGDETNRCEALKKFEQSEEGKALYFMTLSKNSKFYNKPEEIKEGVDELASAKAYKSRLCTELFKGNHEETGNYISDKIRKAYKDKTKVDLDAWGDKMIEQIHQRLFPDSQNKDMGKEQLTLEERKIFIEVVYYFLTNELAQQLPNLKSMNTSCKDDIDRGIGFSTVDYGAKLIVNDLEMDEKSIKEILIQVFARALFARQRPIIEERMEMLLKVLAFMMNNKQALKELHVDAWGNTMPSATMV